MRTYYVVSFMFLGSDPKNRKNASDSPEKDPKLAVRGSNDKDNLFSITRPDRPYDEWFRSQNCGLSARCEHLSSGLIVTKFCVFLFHFFCFEIEFNFVLHRFFIAAPTFASIQLSQRISA
jgi:hypothetical protein